MNSVTWEQEAGAAVVAAAGACAPQRRRSRRVRKWSQVWLVGSHHHGILTGQVLGRKAPFHPQKRKSLRNGGLGFYAWMRHEQQQIFLACEIWKRGAFTIQHSLLDPTFVLPYPLSPSLKSHPGFGFGLVVPAQQAQNIGSRTAHLLIIQSRTHTHTHTHTQSFASAPTQLARPASIHPLLPWPRWA